MATAEPTSTPLPIPFRKLTSDTQSKPSDAPEEEPSQDFKPIYRLHLQDLDHPASAQFLSLVDGSVVLPNALAAIRKHLYPSVPGATSKQSTPKFHLPPTRSVTLILRDMDGVAYTTGTDLDPLHKEIHFNLNYIENCAKDNHRRRDEIIGVITHEMVHCYQHNGQGTANGGLIEGIADFVRLRAGLGPPHWFGKGGKKVRGDHWDAGYQNTAFFLEWLEDEYGADTVGRINEALRENHYEEDGGFWEGLFGKEKTIKQLWEDYCAVTDKATEYENENEDEDEEGHDDGAPANGQGSGQRKRRGNEVIEGEEHPSPTVRDGEPRQSSESEDIVVVDKE